jgi:glycosyltransferase involved in cell wall biosynthesis
MVESMMCGTPVAASCIGASPEVVDEGVTGYCAESPDAFAVALQSAMELDRTSVRQRAVTRYSSERMAHEYNALYARILDVAT